MKAILLLGAFGLIYTGLNALSLSCINSADRLNHTEISNGPLDVQMVVLSNLRGGFLA